MKGNQSNNPVERRLTRSDIQGLLDVSLGLEKFKAHIEIYTLEDLEILIEQLKISNKDEIINTKLETTFKMWEIKMNAQTEKERKEYEKQAIDNFRREAERGGKVAGTLIGSAFIGGTVELAIRFGIFKGFYNRPVSTIGGILSGAIAGYFLGKYYATTKAQAVVSENISQNLTARK